MRCSEEGWVIGGFCEDLNKRERKHPPGEIGREGKVKQAKRKCMKPGKVTMDPNYTSKLSKI